MTRPSLFDRHFIIDGVARGLTPSQMLNPGAKADDAAEPIVDESLDPAPGSASLDPERVASYLSAVRETTRRIPFAYSEQFSRCAVFKALIDAIWADGHFTLEDLSLAPRWRWEENGLGSMDALYESVRSVSEFADYLDLKIADHSLEEGTPALEIGVPGLEARAIPDTLVADPDSWIVYVPFDPAEYRLGGSLLSQALSINCGPAPQLDDPDYLIDCYEVVRELVEDRVAISGATVCEGGLICAIESLCRGGVGADINLSGLMRSCPGAGLVQILFGEIPGVIIQIRDDDFDYLDAELLLQDVMYFPLGHPTPLCGDVRYHGSNRSVLGGILDSLIR